MFVKKKTELRPRPKLPTRNHILKDLENAPKEDPVFAGSTNHLIEYSVKDGFTVSNEFMSTIKRLKELEILLIKQRLEIEESHMELLDIAGIIRIETSK